MAEICVLLGVEDEDGGHDFSFLTLDTSRKSDLEVGTFAACSYFANPGLGGEEVYGVSFIPKALSPPG